MNERVAEAEVESEIVVKKGRDPEASTSKEGPEVTQEAKDGPATEEEEMSCAEESIRTGLRQRQRERHLRRLVESKSPHLFPGVSDVSGPNHGRPGWANLYNQHYLVEESYHDANQTRELYQPIQMTPAATQPIGIAAGDS